MHNLTIIIPILNEKNTIPILIKNLKKYPICVSYIFCDGGSLDDSILLLKDLISKLPSKYRGLHHSKIISHKLNSPSIMKTLSLAKNDINTNYILIHPVDIDCSHIFNDLNLLHDYYHFFKTYVPGNLLLSVQEFYLNYFRSKIQNQFVWTNAPLMKKNSLPRNSAT